MQVESPEKIRNLAVVGHNDTGKTTLASALLYTGGIANRLNRVEDGNTLTDFDPQEIERQIAVNFTSNVLITKALAPWLFIDHGRLAIIGSTAHKGAKGFATYAATKAAMAGFAKSLRSEWKDRASVSLIHHGPTRTAMHDKAGLSLGAARAFFMSTPRAGKSIEKAIRKGDDNRKLTRTFGWRAALSRPGDLQL